MIGIPTDPWLVLRTRSRQESTVEKSLKQKAINSFLPLHNVLRPRKNKKVVLQMPLFPGYIFVQPQPEQFEKIRYIPGSCGLIFVGDRPAAMPETDLEAVKILVRSGVELAQNDRLFVGRRVEVIAGPFMGVQGELVRFQSQDRLVINANLLSSSVSVEVDANLVCPL